MNELPNFDEIIKDDKLLQNLLLSDSNKLNLRNLQTELVNKKNKNKPLLIKLCLHPCSGKTHFFKLVRGYYNGIFVCDIDCWNFNSYKRKRIMLKNLKCHTCLMGHYENSNEEDNILDITILISYKLLRNNLKKRENERQGEWSKLENIIKSRKRLLTESYKYNFPIFGTIQQALDFIIRIYKTGKYNF